MTGLSMVAFVTGVLLLALWGRRRLAAARVGAIDPGMLQVVARAGLTPNQGVAVVRIGRRHVLVSSGEGGVRMLQELDESDFTVGSGSDGTADVVTPAPTPSFRRHLDRFQMNRGQATAGLDRFRATLGFLLVVGAAFAFSAADLSAQNPLGGGPLGGGAGAGPDAVGGVGSLFDALPRVGVEFGDDEEGLRLNGTVGTVVLLGLMALTPTLLLLTTSFTRILIVLHLMRQALGTQNTPPGHLLAGLALLLSAAVMAPTLDQIRYEAVDPWMAGEIDEGVMMARAVVPMRYFMLEHARDADLSTFLRISQSPPPMGPDDIPNAVLMSAFVTSELRTAFEIGFAIFLPFIVIDLVVAAVLTSMGMFMLPPTMIALPCKLMLFVLMDGWTLLLGTLAESFL